MINFIGKFHPLLVHLPIGFISFWLIIEFLERISSYKSGEKTKQILLISSAISSIISSVLGYFLSLSGEYNVELLDEHKWLGIWLSVLLVLISIIYYLLKSKIYFKYIYNGSIFLVCILLTLTGHHGGSLTHGEQYLSLSQLSENKNENVVEIKDIKQAVVFSDLVQPIFNKKCVACHNTGKLKGGLLMDTYENLLKGGESGAVIIASNSAQSELIKLINLEPIEKRAMPPKGKIPLTTDEKALLTWWIDAGATKDKKVSELKPDAAIMAVLTKFQAGGNAHNTDETPSLPEVTAAADKDVQAIQMLGANVQKMANNSNLLDVRVIINKKDWDDKKTENLSKIKEQVYILDLSGTAISSKSLNEIAKFSNLNKLFIQNTNLDDANLEALSNLSKLESLNLYNVPISDAGLKKIASIKSLKKLFLWKTKINQNAIEALKKSNPELEIVVGITA